ncbi:MAG: hypothetical protein JWM91_5343 [Rhodospirillales bacterium]|nr:hypothetical protein [Rhodospirillales bacterium]
MEIDRRRYSGVPRLEPGHRYNDQAGGTAMTGNSHSSFAAGLIVQAVSMGAIAATELNPPIKEYDAPTKDCA